MARVGARPYRAVRRRGRRVVVAVDTAIAWLLHRTARSVYVRDAGRGGPLLVVVDDVGFSRYLVEILRAEGISSFRAADAAQVGPELLVEHDLVLLGPISVDASLVDRLTTWVEGGGNLAGSLVSRNLVDRFYWIQSPLWLGAGAAAFEGLPPGDLETAERWRPVERRGLGPDTLLVLDRS